MKKSFKFLLFSCLILVMTACTTQKHLYYYETNKNISINETLPLVSIQVSGREFSWKVDRTLYTFYFTNANKFAKMIFNQIHLNDLGIVIPQKLHDGKVNLKNYTTEMPAIINSTYDWGIPVVDELNNPKRMDEDILNCLNENINSDYYLVIDADILRMQFPRYFGLIPFRIKYEFSIVVYKNDGTKIFSKNYRYKTKKVPGSIYDADSYYRGLVIALKKVKGKIIKDLANLKAIPVPTKPEHNNTGDRV